MRRNIVMTFALLAVAFALSSTALAQKSTVLRVLVIKTDNVAGYVQELDKGQALLKKLGVQETLRVWQARFAGPEAGSVVVSIEFPSMSALVDSDTKTNANSEYKEWLKGLDKIRKIVSDSLYTEQ
jgi:LPS O-antigen subunit length determinant protein (WzzB/FepE family)